MLLLSDAPGNENPQMANAFVNRVDNSLAIRTNFIDAPVKIENRSQTWWVQHNNRTPS